MKSFTYLHICKFVCFILLTFQFSYLSSFAQTSKIDSLQKVLSSLVADTNKINNLNNLARELLKMNNSEAALDYSHKAIELAEKLNFEKGKADAYNNIGIINYQKSDYAEALKNHFIALEIREKINDKKGIAYSYNNIGIVYYRQKDLDNSLKYHFQSLKKKEEIGDIRGMVSSNNNIGLIYKEQGNLAEALVNYKKALQLLEKKPDNLVLAVTYNNIGIIYDLQKNFEEALKNYSTSMKIREEIGDLEGVAGSHVNIGTMFLSQKKFEEGETHLHKSFELAKKIEHKQLIMESCFALSELFDEKGNWEKAYQFHRLFSDTKDSIFNEESSKQITEMQTKYETEKKEQQITLLNKDKELQDAQLNRQKIIIWSVTGGLLVVLILSVFIFRERRKSEKLLLNILPAETAHELKKNGKATAKHYESVTVMFTDFKGFTTIAEKLSAEELVSELDCLFKKFDEIISKYPIEKIKTIGDAYMCASGLPTPNTNHAENIVKASLEIQNWMITQNDKWQLRIGVHSGPVTAGVVGDKKFAYDIWGDAVNIASRMESSGEPNKINISGATHELIKDKFNCEFRGKIPAKNKGEIEMYFVEKAQIVSIAEV